MAAGWGSFTWVSEGVVFCLGSFFMLWLLRRVNPASESTRLIGFVTLSVLSIVPCKHTENIYINRLWVVVCFSWRFVCLFCEQVEEIVRCYITWNDVGCDFPPRFCSVNLCTRICPALDCVDKIYLWISWFFLWVIKYNFFYATLCSFSSTYKIYHRLNFPILLARNIRYRPFRLLKS